MACFSAAGAAPSPEADPTRPGAAAPHGALRFLPLQLRRPRPSDGCKEESPTLSVKMKWDFNYYHVHSGIKPVKPDDRRQGSYTTAYLEGSYKDCIKDYERLSDFGSRL